MPAPTLVGAAAMGKGMSLLLDLMRFLAAAVVVVGHASQPFFSSGRQDLTYVAITSVGFFFVLSGYVIQHTLWGRTKTWRTYTVERLARIYSVLVPALLLTVILDTLGRTLNPTFYSNWVDQSDHLGRRLLLCLGFLNQAHGSDAAFMSNSPVWSLGYEVPYYAMFGILIFARGIPRILLTALAAIVWGGNILVLFPLWLAGVALYRRIATTTCSKPVGIAALFAIPVVAAITLQAASHWPGKTIELLNHGIPGRMLAYFLSGRSEGWILLYGGGAITLCLIVAASAYEAEVARWLARFEGRIRRLASGTFSLYLYHFPILCFIGSLPFYRKGQATSLAVLLATTFTSCFLLSGLTESRKDIWARLFRRILPEPTPR